MRILSQNGMIDFPYEQCGIKMFFNELFTGEYEIDAHMASGKTYKMAEYSTAEKAQKAMEMLQKAYSPILVLKEPEEGIEANIKPRDWLIAPALPTQRIEVCDNFYFRFPSDDEIEV